MRIKRYTGSKNKCDGCGREFKRKDYIFYCEDMIFCHYSGSGGLSCIKNKIKTENPHLETMIFEGVAPPEYGSAQETKEGCDYCGKRFQFGEDILFHPTKRLIFCGEESGAHTCAANYFGKKTKGGIIVPRRDIELAKRRFHGNT